MEHIFKVFCKCSGSVFITAGPAAYYYIGLDERSTESDFWKILIIAL